MNKNNERKLFKQFKFLNSRDMPNGITAGDGWYRLIYNMCKKIKLDSYPDTFIITNIECKGDQLRVHSKNGNNTTRYIIDQAGYDAFETCVNCSKNRNLENCPTCTPPLLPSDLIKEEEDTENDTTVASCSGSCGPGNCSTGC